MKLNLRTKSSAIFAAALQLTPSAWAREPAVQALARVEILPDGNERDPAPSAETLKRLFATSRKNMVAFPEGSFEMGDFGPKADKRGRPYDIDADSKPLHTVRLSAFAIGKYPVTYAEFDLFTAAMRLPRINQSTFSKKFRKPDNPAGVTWQGAKDYCAWLGRNLSEKFDLPTEAQWEYAARSGGKLYVYPTDNGKLEPGRNVASYDQRKAAGGLTGVSSFPPNPAGLHAMGAGAIEYTNDWYDRDYYSKAPVDNPRGPATGSNRVGRGHYGGDEMEMTFKRWSLLNEGPPRTWTSYSGAKSERKREIPLTRYSDIEDKTFRCVAG